MQKKKAKHQHYAVGEKAATGHQIASILGQSQKGCVYTTTNNELRWEYWENDGELTDSLREIVAKFDTLMARIAASGLTRDKKLVLYTLLGKSLFSAIDSPRPKSPKLTFQQVEEQLAKISEANSPRVGRPISRRIFIVHGHDDAATESVARFLERLDLEPVILKERPNAGRTIIEKFEQESDVAFAIVLLTPDDIGASAREPNSLRPRARQNVIFELGYFSGVLGRFRVIALLKDSVEMPSDYQGVIYLPFDLNDGWRLKVAIELQEAGLRLDMNKVVRGRQV